GSRFHLSHDGLDPDWISWIDEHRSTRGCGQQLSRRRPSRFAANSAVKKLMPVALPAGRARLATRPSLTGSSPTPKTMGIVVVAALAASAAGVVPRRSLIPGGGPDRPPTPEIDCSGLLPIGTRSQRSGPERNRSHQGLG